MTEENKKEFVDRYLDWYVNQSIKRQFDAFFKGFNMVTSKADLIKLFTAQDLYLAICGGEDLDFQEMKRTAIYDVGYDENSETIKYFWKILIEEFSEEQKKNFLKFLTGSDRSPLRGLSDIKLTISKHEETDHLPSAHTCFNHLVLPNYKNYEVLKEKLLKAIENFQGFGLF